MRAAPSARRGAPCAHAAHRAALWLRFQCPRHAALLNRLAAEHPGGPWRRVRLTLDAVGPVQRPAAARAHTRAGASPGGGTPIAARGAAGEFLRHKTTRRARLYAAFKPPNRLRPSTSSLERAGELTECSFGNLALEIDGRWLTPRLDAGLLPGVLRASTG